jgi:hypothetical protein
MFIEKTPSLAPAPFFENYESKATPEEWNVYRKKCSNQLQPYIGA